jgi:hypothetical protein
MILSKKLKLLFFVALFGSIIWLLFHSDPILLFNLLLTSIICAWIMFKNNGSYMLLYVMYLVVVSLLQLTDNLSFVYLPQLRGLIEENPIDLFLSGHVWAPRFMVTYPAIVLSNMFRIDIDTTFTIYSVLLLFFMCLTILQIIKAINVKRLSEKSIITYTFIIVANATLLMLVMNGRLIPAFLGMAFILYQQIQLFKNNSKLNIRIILWLTLGFFLSTVSSGTMMVALLQIFMGIYYYLRSRQQSLKPLFYIILLTSIVTGSYVLKMIMKNLNFYGGGWEGLVSMGSHGLGKFLQISPAIIAIAFLFLLTGIYFYLTVFKKMIYDQSVLVPIYLSIPISISCGIFGFSTGLMIIPTLIILLNIKIEKWV